MLRSEQMQKVRIICLVESKYSVVSGLHRLGVIDLRKSELNTGDDAPLPNFAQLSELLIKVDGALSILGKRPIRKTGEMSSDAIIREMEKLSDVDRVYALRNERQAINEDMKLLDYASMEAKCFSGTGINFSSLSSESLAFSAILVDGKELGKFRSGSRKLMKNSEIIENQTGKDQHLIFIAYKKGDTLVEDALKGIKSTELDLHAKYLESTPEKVMDLAERRKSGDEKRIAEIEKELQRLSDILYSRLSGIKESLEIEIERSEVSSIFKKTDKTFALEGWAPKRRVADLKALVNKASKGRSVIEEIETEELAPTLVERPGFLKPFDYLMEFFSMPRSDEIDPTWIFIISFPIFYGIMVSDVGYGIASFILSSIIIRKTDPQGLMCNTAKIWRLSAIPAIIVGFITDQYFGFSLNHLFVPAFQAVSWFTDITWIIVLTIIFGIIQVTLGFLFGFINESGHGNNKLAISKLTSIAALLSGTVAVSGVFFHALPMGISVDAAIVAIISIISTIALSGTEAAEITNLITHPLSYARLMGFGLGSIIIAQLIDKAFTPSLSGGILVFIIYLVIFVLLHTLNMILSIFEGIVQGARLNFVEFFSKFYKGGGIKYKPFYYKRVYTEE
ncbi:MAG: V-type ATP synthase subunit I [Candidatus Micrarchaeaceae archaeon]